MPSRLLILGIDAARPELLRTWASAGKLPAIQRLIGRGRSGEVHGVDGFYIGSTWPSFSTGLNPAGHGFYRIEQLASGRYEFFRPLDSETGVGGTPFWKLASNAGRRVAVLDVPLTRLDRDLHGVQIVEWGQHDTVFGFQTAPETLAEEVLSIAGAHPLPGDCDADRRDAADFETFIAALERAAAQRAALTRALLEREPWDLMIQVFTEAHCAGHQCWHLHDPSHPSHDPALRQTLGDPLERVYRAVDRAIGDILENAGDGHVLLFSAHGMSSFRGADFLLPEILYRLGVTARPAPVTEPKEGPLRAAARSAWRALPGFAREALRPRRGAPAESAPIPYHSRIAADVARSHCFPIPNGFPLSGIRLNLRGREPQGVLAPGAEAEAFCEELDRDLRALRDERTGGPLVAAVHRTDRLHRGPRRDALPDLLVEWNAAPTGSLAHAGGRGATIRAFSPKTGTVEASNGYGRTGEHLPTGMFVWSGPGVTPGDAAPVSVMDFHPTVCAHLGLEPPRVDGRVIAAIAGC